MTTLCGTNAYTKKYYFNPDFKRLPEDVQLELKAICVEYTEEVGGIFTIDFADDGTPQFSVMRDPTDVDYDEIGSELLIRRIQKDKKDLMERIAVFYRVFILGDMSALQDIELRASLEAPGETDGAGADTSGTLSEKEYFAAADNMTSKAADTGSEAADGEEADV